ncbi:hypothetical protein A9Z42_0076300 [Trichoderma parareesei]|uniref:Uncharacterized protein n=1 Tax=Trichoderma parareesei TaxID=858221 RepID=A0A2H3A6M6_TRIPA|nr:hypothetical protein A9Z42_0076300 [Trichoderma parareesei]
MSSPDPLNEPTIIAVATTAAAAATSANSSLAPIPKTEPASRRVSHSQPHRSISPAASPRKHTLNLLQAGKTASSQRLSVAVQVQTEGHGDGGANDTMASTPGGTRRKLFKSPVQSPSTVRRRTDHAVTTTVPLRETGEDELTAAITPSRRRGRPRKSNGTPAPQAGVKRRAGSPISRNPRRVRTDRFGGGGGGGGGESTTQLHFDEGKENFHATPATAKRGRPPKAQAVQPSSELGATKRGRRRQAMAPDELVGIAEEAAAERSQAQSGRRVSESDAVDLIQPPPSRQGAENDAAHGSDAASNADTESDWIPGPNNDATPRAAAQPSTLQLPSRSDHDNRAPEASDHSTADEHINDYSSQTNDTIAQGEDFSMIFMDSIPSLQGSRNGNSSFQPAEDDDDVGDETHLIINNTLASLKREVAESSDPVEVTEQIEIPEEPEIEDQPEPEPEFVPIIRESARNARLSLSPWWSRKPKKMGTSGASPLRHQTLLRSAAKRSGRLFRFDHEREDEPTPTKAGKQPSSAQSRRDRSNDYRESFSEMPRNYLDTAAPKPLNFSATQDDRRVDLEEYGLHREDEHAEEEYAQEEHAEEDHAQEGHAEEHAEEHDEEHAEEEHAEGAHANEEHADEEYAEEHVEQEHGEALAWHTEAPADDNLQESANNAPQQFFFAAQPYSAVALGPRRIAMSEISSPVRHIEDEESEHQGQGQHADHGVNEYHGGYQDHEQGAHKEYGEKNEYEEPEELEEQEMQEVQEVHEEPEEHGEHEGYGEHEKHEEYEEHEEYVEDERPLQQEELEEEEEQEEDMELDHEEEEREEEEQSAHHGGEEEDMEEYNEELEAEDHEQQGGEEDSDDQENHKAHEESLKEYAEQEGIGEHEEFERHEEHEDYVEEDGDFEEHEEPQQHGEEFNHRDEHDDHEDFGDHDDHEDFEEHGEEVDQHDEHDQLKEHGEEVDQYEEHDQYGEEADQHDEHDKLEAHEAQDHEVQEVEEQEVEHYGLHDEHEDQEEVEDREHHKNREQQEHYEEREERKVRPYEIYNHRRPNFLARRQFDNKENHAEEQRHSVPPQQPEQPKPTSEREVRPYEFSNRWRPNFLARRRPETKGNHIDQEMHSRSSQGPEQLEPTPEREVQPVEATPPQQMSSPLQDPQSVPQDHVQYPVLRPVLSSIMRAGRVLQTVTSDPPSPREREKQLRSPFRSSASKEPSHSATEGSQPPPSKSPPQPFRFGRDQSAANGVDGAGEEPDRVDEEEEMGEEDQDQVREDDDEREEAQMEEEEEQQQEQQEEEEQNEEEEDDDDDIDLWEYEAQREVPPRPVLQQPLMPMTQDRNTTPGLESSRRDAQEAPAAVTATRALPNASRTKQTIGRQQLDRDVEEDESPLLSRKQPEQAPATASNPKRFDLSSFFSSPAALPGLLAEKFKSTKQKTSAQQIDQQAAAQQEEPPTLPTTSLFSSLDQTVNGSRDFGRTAPASSSIPSDPPVEEQVVGDAPSPATPEERGLPTITQKQNFVPRPRQANDSSFFQPSSSQLSTSPTRMQLTHEDIQRWQLETSHAGDDSPSLKPLLRPLPPRHASPKKSNLRSPLKPRTPGRVVEFSGSVLSPEEQARLREQRLQANGDVSREDIGTAAAVPNHVQPRAGKGSMPRPQPQPQQQRQQQNQNRPSILAPRIIKPAGVTKKPPVRKHRRREPPSQTVWTRQHWIFLDTLLQMRRQRPFSERYPPVSQRYLGKVVTSMGESLVLEKWHLECVDAFKSQIKGWDEGELAKRLFALILGEAQRRRASLGQSSPGVMFH